MSHLSSILTSRAKLKTMFTESVELAVPTKRELPIGEILTNGSLFNTNFSMITDKHAKHAKALADLLQNSDAEVPPALREMRAPMGGQKRGRSGGGGFGGPSKRGRDCKSSCVFCTLSLNS